MATREARQSSSEDARWRRFADPDSRGVLPFVGIVTALAVWYVVTSLATGVLSNFAPQHAFPALADLVTSQEFYARHVYSSMFRFTGALVLCLGVGLPLGVAIGYFHRAERTTSVVFQFLRMISPVAWFPVALLVFTSGGHAAPIFVMFMAGVWPLMFNTAHGINTIDRDWLKVAFSLGGDTRRTIQKVVIPGVLPDMLSGLRLSIGILWIMLVPAEILGVNSGLGYFVLNARYEFNYADIPAVMMVIGFIGYWLDLGVRKLQKRWSWQ